MSLWRHSHLRACVCFRDLARQDKGFKSACMPVCIVVRRIYRQQLWFILYSQGRGPFYLTGKVKAYSLEAVLQRSTCSLGMRNREEDGDDMYSSNSLFGPRAAPDTPETLGAVFAAKAQQSLSFSSLCPHSLAFALSSSPRYTSDTTVP